MTNYDQICLVFTFLLSRLSSIAMHNIASLGPALITRLRLLTTLPAVLFSISSSHPIHFQAIDPTASSLPHTKRLLEGCRVPE